MYTPRINPRPSLSLTDDLLQTIFEPSRLLVFPHPNPEAAVQAYFASFDAAHLYWDGVSSLSGYLLSIGVRKEGLDELSAMLEAGHYGMEIGGTGTKLIGGRSMGS